MEEREGAAAAGVTGGTTGGGPEAPLVRLLDERTRELAEKDAELAALRARLATARAQLLQAEKLAALGQLTAGIAHELKNPLNFVNNFAELNLELAIELAEEAAQSPTTRLCEMADVLADIRQGAEKIREHGRRASDIIQGMMLHARGASSERRPADLDALVDQCVTLAAHGARGEDGAAAIPLARERDGAAGTVTVAAQDIGRVVLNLIDNALYAVRERQRAAPRPWEPKVTVVTRRREGRAEIVVRDNGTGIPEAVRARLFEPFFTTKPAGAGTGLGLSLCQEIVVQQHGGTLSVESTPGEGATFIVSLPA